MSTINSRINFKHPLTALMLPLDAKHTVAQVETLGSNGFVSIGADAPANEISTGVSSPCLRQAAARVPAFSPAYRGTGTGQRVPALR